MTPKYTPINCNFYDYFEAFAVKRQIVTLVYFNEDGDTETVESRIKDLYSRNKVEFVLLQNDLEIRLDYVKELEGMVNSGYCEK
ncbi:MAG: Rho-binding antiterminator [Chitinophagales bacterium]